jgi:hypothetical protein
MGPFALGAAAAGRFTTDLFWLAIAALAAYLSRHPASILIKVRSGHRSKRDRVPALFWAGIYSLVAVAALVPACSHLLPRLPIGWQAGSPIELAGSYGG